MRKLKFLVFIFGLILSIHTYAWTALAHMVVADIAYERLQPKARIKIDKMVQDLSKEYPTVTLFNQMAPWPDTLRTQKIEAFTHWHYIDYAFSDDGTPIKNLIDTDNAVWAINQTQTVVKNSNANQFERARFLAFLVHIVGDLHQPLHTTTRISAANPDGDRGGNLFKVRAITGDLVTLHKFWDDGANSFTAEPSTANSAALAHTITSQYPEEYFGVKTKEINPDIWVKEGFNLATSFVYTTPENQMPNNAYVSKTKEISQQRVALAGYRLANLLNSLLNY